MRAVTSSGAGLLAVPKRTRGGALNDPDSIFATDEHAKAHPSTYAPSGRPVAPDAVEVGERNARVNAARKKAMLANLARAAKRWSGQC